MASQTIFSLRCIGAHHDVGAYLLELNQSATRQLVGMRDVSALESGLVREVFDRMTQGTAIFDAHLQICSWNRSFPELLALDDGPKTEHKSLFDALGTSKNLHSAARRSLQDLVTAATAKGDDAKHAIDIETRRGPRMAASVTQIGDQHWSLQIEPSMSTVVEGLNQASLDPLTGLQNRGVLTRRLAGACNELALGGDPFAVLIVDLDRFKSVNDTLGHPVGDALLRTVAERLLSAVRTGDLVSRMGGDEFAIVQSASNETTASALAARIVELMKRPFILHGHILNIGASVGVALAPQDATDPDTLLVQADLGLYQAKANGRSTYGLFRPELQDRAQARRTLELELRKALMLRQYELYYQPQIDVVSGELSGFEALLRWRHPTRGLINPSAFVPLLEELGLIVPVGEWVLRAACAEAVRWPKALSVAVNVAAPQFESDRLVSTVKAALAASGLPSSRLEIEVTENALLHHGEATRATLHVLREMGVRVAMDEFGTGYSSMSHLRSFPFDRIKIDRSFIDNAAVNSHDAAIVRTIAGLGTILGMRTTAKGVETAEQLEQMRAHGCTEVQGYLLGRPVAEKELGSIIEAFGSTEPSSIKTVNNSREAA